LEAEAEGQRQRLDLRRQTREASVNTSGCRLGFKDRRAKHAFDGAAPAPLDHQGARVATAVVIAALRDSGG
jgi:hypothetical protein